jgi:hypothetical protein
MVAMTDEPGLSRDTQPAAAIASIRAHAARYRENAAHFTELAEQEPVESIRDQWKIVARDYAYLARTLETNGAGTRDPLC